jgi:hypothetical protein
MPGFDEDLSWTSLRENPFHILLDPRLGASKFWTMGQTHRFYDIDRITASPASYNTVSLLSKSRTGQKVRPESAATALCVAANLRFEVLKADASLQKLAPGPDTRQIFVWLLTESTWQLAVTTLESKWQRVRLRSSRLAGSEAFVLLIGYAVSSPMRKT